MILTHTSNKDVGKAIVIVIAHGNAHAIHLDIETSAAGHVRESAVAIIAVEFQRASFSFMRRPIGAADKKNILPPVAVVVEKSATRAESLRKEFAAISAAVMTKVDSGLRRDIRQLEPETA